MGTRSLLGLGLTFCVQRPYPTNQLSKSIKHFKTDVRLQYTFLGSEDEELDNQYIKKLYVKSKWEHPQATSRIEDHCDRFESCLKKELAKYQRQSPSNLSNLQFKVSNLLKIHNNIIVIPSDKNLGPAILDRDHYISRARALSEHLNDTDTYQPISENQAWTHQSSLSYKFASFKTKYQYYLGEAVMTFIKRGQEQYGDKISQFYLAIKVHKIPYKFSPFRIYLWHTSLISVSMARLQKLQQCIHLVVSPNLPQEQ